MSSPARVAAPHPTPLTRVLLAYEPKRYSRRLHFGEPVRKDRQDRAVTHAYFEPDEPFGYVVWEAGAYGTKRWEMVIGHTRSPGDAVQAIDGITPGVAVLLHARTAHYVRKTLAVCDAIKATGTALTDVPDAFWRRVATAFSLRQDAPPFATAGPRRESLRKAVER